MAGYNNSQNQDDPDSQDPAISLQPGDNVTNPWYYRQPSGLNDWAAQMGRFSQGNNAANASGTINGEDLQLASPDLPGLKAATDSPWSAGNPGGDRMQPVTPQTWQGLPDFTLPASTNDGASPDIRPIPPRQIQPGMQQQHFENLPWIYKTTTPGAIPQPDLRPIPTWRINTTGPDGGYSDHGDIQLLKNEIPGAAGGASQGQNDNSQGAPDNAGAANGAAAGGNLQYPASVPGGSGAAGSQAVTQAPPNGDIAPKQSAGQNAQTQSPTPAMAGSAGQNAGAAVQVRRALPVDNAANGGNTPSTASPKSAGGVGANYPIVTAVDKAHGYTYQPKAQLYLVTANPEDPKNPVIRSVPDSARSIKNATIFINGMDNDPLNAAQLGLNHTGKSQFYMVYNPTNGGLSDFLQRCIPERLGAHLTVDKTAGDLLKRFDLPSANVFAHSQGTMILNHALTDLRGQGVNMQGLNLNYDGSAANYYASKNIAGAAGAKIARFGGNPADAVDNIVGLNTVNPLRVAASVADAPFLFDLAGRSGSPHGELGGGKYVRWLNKVPLFDPILTSPKYP